MGLGGDRIGPAEDRTEKREPEADRGRKKKRARENSCVPVA